MTVGTGDKGTICYCSKLLLCVFAFIGMVPSGLALSASVVNRDNQPREIAVTESGVTKNRVIAPFERVDQLCFEQCLIGLGGETDQFEIENNDKIVIEEGQFFIEEEIEVSDEPEIGDGG